MKKRKAWGIWDKKKGDWHCEYIYQTATEAHRQWPFLGDALELRAFYLPRPLPKGKSK